MRTLKVGLIVRHLTVSTKVTFLGPLKGGIEKCCPPAIYVCEKLFYFFLFPQFFIILSLLKDHNSPGSIYPLLNFILPYPSMEVLLPLDLLGSARPWSAPFCLGTLGVRPIFVSCLSTQ